MPRGCSGLWGAGAQGRERTVAPEAVLKRRGASERSWRSMKVVTGPGELEATRRLERET